MATTETADRAHDRHFHRRPFTTWMKRLANLKNSSSSDSKANGAPSKYGGGERGRIPQPRSLKKSNAQKNNPYITATHVNGGANPPTAYLANGDLVSLYTSPSGRSISEPSFVDRSIRSSSDDADSNLEGEDDNEIDQATHVTGTKSVAHTLSTDPGTTASNADSSGKATNTTVGGRLSSHGGGHGSTFSSPAPSVRSLTTTLTTIQSTAPSNILPGGHSHGHGHVPTFPSSYSTHSPSHGHHTSAQFFFAHPFPPTSPPPSALPSHLAPHPAPSGPGHPTTYSAATANNLLTDNASILTLASSSKRRRRHSLDTNASVRALAPSSLFGGSRESLPLSVLSQTPTDLPISGSLHQARASVSGLAGGAERASVYSTAGYVAGPSLSSERNSYYAAKGDAASIRSGKFGHARHDSMSGSIGLPAPGGPLASPREFREGRISRRNSGWGEVDVDSEEEVTEGEGEGEVEGKIG
ncbi:MAG: hypothetical protein M1829_006066 [Trizodia sp. TS-e1964]|nr:MAG: hypothetical protein M1829_006066 [Trizodia sp. TS-e1964]